MTSTPSNLPAVLDAMQTALSARAGLSGVTVLSGPADPSKLGVEYLALGIGTVHIPQSQRAAQKQFRQEATIIPCEIRANATPTADTEAGIRAARDRAFEIFAEVQAYLYDDPNIEITTVDALHLPDVTYEAGWDDKVRFALIQFVIGGNIVLIST